MFVTGGEKNCNLSQDAALFLDNETAACVFSVSIDEYSFNRKLKHCPVKCPKLKKDVWHLHMLLN